MKKRMLSVCMLAVLGMFVTQAYSGGYGDLAIEVEVAPQTLQLGADQGGEVTVHTDIPLGLVIRSTVELSGLPAFSTYSDSCGQLAAKFSEEDVKSLVAVPSATLTLTGLTIDGISFAGSDTVRVTTWR